MRPKMSEVGGRRSETLRLCASALNPVRPRVLRGYTLGSDGLYRLEQHFGRSTEIITRDPTGRQLYVQRIAADVRGQVTCQTR